MPANDVFELSIDATYNGQQMTNVMHFIQVGTDGTGDARTALLNVWLSFFDPGQRALQVPAVVHSQDRCRRILPTQTQTLIVANVGVGLATGNGIPQNQCAILRMYATPAGRKGVGHQKLYGVRDTGVRDGRIDDAFFGLASTYGDVFEADQTDISGFVFRAGVLGLDSVLRTVQRTSPLGRIKQVHSRSFNVGA